MKVVEYMGEYWRLTDKQYMEQMRRVVRGDGFNCTVGRRLDFLVDADVTDIEPWQALELLSGLISDAELDSLKKEYVRSVF